MNYIRAGKFIRLFLRGGYINWYRFEAILFLSFVLFKFGTFEYLGRLNFFQSDISLIFMYKSKVWYNARFLYNSSLILILWTFRRCMNTFLNFLLFVKLLIWWNCFFWLILRQLLNGFLTDLIDKQFFCFIRHFCAFGLTIPYLLLSFKNLGCLRRMCFYFSSLVFFLVLSVEICHDTGILQRDSAARIVWTLTRSLDSIFSWVIMI